MKGIGGAGAALACAILVTGCGQSANGAADVAATGDRAQTPDHTANQPAEAVRRYIGKPRPPVTVTLAPGAALESGVPGAITLLVRTGVPISRMQIALEGDEGLAIAEVPAGTSGTRHLATDIPSLAVGDALSVPIRVVPTSGGTRFISGLLSFEVNGMPQGAPFSVSVRVGGPVTVAPVTSKPQRPAFRDASGELIDSMPAETTVR